MAVAGVSEVKIYVSNQYERPFVEIPLYVIIAQDGYYVRSADGIPIQSMSKKLIEAIFTDGGWEETGAKIVELDE